jgi:hypothetical protein
MSLALEPMKIPSSLQSFRSTNTFGLILASACALLSGCGMLAEREWFASEHVRVAHSDRHCNDVGLSAASPFVNADLVESATIGIGGLGDKKTDWEVIARSIAFERDGDLALVRPCDGDRPSMEFAQIEVWRTRGFTPKVQDDPSPERGTLMPPPQTTYGTRLQNIFECFEQARVTRSPITSVNKKQLGAIDATEYFSSGGYFPGYARVDRYFRPTNTGDLRLSMLHLDRPQSAWAANVYENLSQEEKPLFAESYLGCLFDRGYGLRSANSSNEVLQPPPKRGAAEFEH